MKYFKRIVILVTFFILALALTPPVPHAKAAIPSDSLTFLSDTTWKAYDADPAVSNATLLGQAQLVCLNSSYPSPCPPGATLYGFNGSGWRADISSIPGAHWIWAPHINGSTTPAAFGQFYFSRTFQFNGSKAFGSISISADDFAEVRVNGHIIGTIGSISDFQTAEFAQSFLTTFDLSPFLGPGANVVTIRAENGPFGLCCNYAGDPAGVVFGGNFRIPSIQINPSQGPVGTKVFVQGSGFMSQQIEVTFENALLGITTSVNGSFTFTFNVPISQPGLQHVEAVDLLTRESAVANFVVIPVSTLSISVDVGTLYFPGDTANVYTLATLGGTPLNASTLQLQLTLTKPDGTIVTLNNTFVGGGMFRSTYKIPASGTIGTYAVIAKGHAANVPDASALTTFEVKPTWVSAQGPALTATGAALTGVAAVAAVIWRRGIFRSRPD